MRRLLFILALFGPAVAAQPADSIYTIVSEPPALLPSQREAYSQIRGFFAYPATAAADSVTGIVMLRLVVDTTGLAQIDTVLRSVRSGCDDAARAVVPYVRFAPGRHQGQAVRTYVTLPVPCRPRTEPASGDVTTSSRPLNASPDAPHCVLEETTPPEILPNNHLGMRVMQALITYPEEALKAGIQGRVHVRFKVDPEGIPHTFSVDGALGHGLDEEAVRAVSTLRFRPATCNGIPIEFDLTMPITFRR